MRHCSTFLLFLALSLASGCTTSSPRSDTGNPPPSRYVMVVTRLNGRNLVSFPNGEPDSTTRKAAQEFADDLLHLKEGEQKTITLAGPLKRTDKPEPAQ